MAIISKESFEKSIQLSGILLLFLLAVPPIILSLLFFIGIPYRFEISLSVLLVCFVAYFSIIPSKTLFIKGFVVFLVVVCVCYICAKYSFDSTDDGAYYHKAAIGLLKEGWNPVFLSSFEFNNNTGSIDIDIAKTYSGSFLWAEAYPKFSWYFSSFVYYFTDRIETGKVSNYLFIYVLFVFAYTRAFRQIHSVPLKLLVSLLIAFHPIAVIQSHHYYLDGICGCVLIILMIILSDNYGKHWKSISNTDKLVLFFLIVWAMNLKFSIALFCFLICLAFFISSCIRLRTFLVGHFVNLFLIGAFSVVVVGFAPYITNLIRHSDLLYGFSGLDISDESCNTIFGVEGLNRVERSLASIFGKMSHGAIYHSLDELLKIPFTFNKSELDFYKTVDARVCGYGIYTSAIFLVITAVLMFSLIKKKAIRSISLCQYLFILLIYIEIFSFTTSYQLRYIPHIYYIVLVVIYYLYDAITKSANKAKRLVYEVVLGLLVSCLFINIYPTIKVTKDAFKEGFRSEKYLSSADPTVTYDVSFPGFSYAGLFYNLKDYGLKYNLIDREALFKKYKSGHYKECTPVSSYFIFMCIRKGND